MFSALVQRRLVQIRNSPAVLEDIPWWYKACHFCAFHQGALGHNSENCFTLKDEVQGLIISGILSFKDVGPNVQANPLPKHGGAYVNMVDGFPRECHIFNVQMVRTHMIELYTRLC